MRGFDSDAPTGSEQARFATLDPFNFWRSATANWPGFLSLIVAAGFALSAAYNFGFFGAFGNALYRVLTPGDYLSGAILLLMPAIYAFVLIFVLLIILTVIAYAATFVLSVVGYFFNLMRSVARKIMRKEWTPPTLDLTSVPRRAGYLFFSGIAGVTTVLIIGFGKEAYIIFLSSGIWNVNSITLLFFSLLTICFFAITVSALIGLWYNPMVLQIFVYSICALIIAYAYGMSLGHSKLRKAVVANIRQVCVVNEENKRPAIDERCLVRIVERGVLYFEQNDDDLYKNKISILFRVDSENQTLVRFDLPTKRPSYWVDTVFASLAPSSWRQEARCAIARRYDTQHAQSRPGWQGASCKA